MQLFPRNKEQWLKFILFPFEAYVCLIFPIYVTCCAIARSEALQAEHVHYARTALEISMTGAVGCGVVFLGAALWSTISGPKDLAYTFIIWFIVSLFAAWLTAFSGSF